jgi:hypothetical protein
MCRPTTRGASKGQGGPPGIDPLGGLNSWALPIRILEPSSEPLNQGGRDFTRQQDMDMWTSSLFTYVNAVTKKRIETLRMNAMKAKRSNKETIK